VGAVVAVDGLMPHQHEKELVYQGGGLQRIIGTFAAHARFCDTPQFGVDEREQLVADKGFPPVAKESCDIALRRSFR
jgi:hypothetical protein